MTEAGMSSRAIASIVGVSQAQVIADRRSGDQNLSPESPATWEPVDLDADVVDAELIDDPPAPKPITGMDGARCASRGRAHSPTETMTPPL